jgi:hypothetical protein
MLDRSKWIFWDRGQLGSITGIANVTAAVAAEGFVAGALNTLLLLFFILGNNAHGVESPRKW